MEFQNRLDELLAEIYECQLNEESKGMTVTLAGYVTKTLSMRSTYIQLWVRLWVNYFIYFKFTPAFLLIDIFMDVL